MHALKVYLQKASLKGVGLLSREKAMVVSGKDHLRQNRIQAEKQRKRVKMKSNRGQLWVERSKSNTQESLRAGNEKVGKKKC